MTITAAVQVLEAEAQKKGHAVYAHGNRVVRVSRSGSTYGYYIDGQPLERDEFMYRLSSFAAQARPRHNPFIR